MTETFEMATPPDASAKLAPSLINRLLVLHLGAEEEAAQVAAAGSGAVLGSLAAVNGLFATLWVTRMDVPEYMRVAEATVVSASAGQTMNYSFLRTTLWLGHIAGPILASLGLALLFLVAFRTLGGRDLRWRQSLALVGHVLLAVALVRTTLTIATCAMTGEWSDRPENLVAASLGVLFGLSGSGFLAAVAHSVDLFSLWTAWLLGRSFGGLLPRSGAPRLVWSLWLLSVLVSSVARVAFPSPQI